MKKQLLAILPLLLFTSLVKATPTIYPTNFDFLNYVNNQTNSSLVADDTNFRKIYVLPPNVAEAEVKGLHTLNANVGFCKELGDLQDYSRQVTAKLKELTNKRDSFQKEVDEVSAQLYQARLDAAKYVADKRMQPLADLDAQINDYDLRMNELDKIISSCKQNCDGFIKDLADVEKAKNQALRDRRSLLIQYASDIREYTKRKAAVDSLELQFNDVGQKFQKIKADLISIHNDFLNMYSSFSKLEGGRAAFLYKSNWDSNIETLRRNNPNYEFEKIVTEKAILFAGISSVNNVPQGSAILSYELPGIQKDNYVDLNSGFPDSLQSNLVLSLVGTCPMLHPEYFDITPGYGAEKMSYGLTVAYNFPSAMKSTVTAKYNMYKMYQKIVSSGSSGGFFSSRTWTNVEERSFFRDSFKVDWVSQDPANEVPEDKRLEMEHEMRRAILERMANLALPMSPNRDAIIAANQPSQHGSVVIASSLMQYCPGNVYCVGGSVILNALDAIFGSSSTTASYMQTQDFELTESWSGSKVVMKPWITSYISK